MSDQITLFINYRRADYAHLVYALRTHLYYLQFDVFMDLEIPPFMDFAEILREKIAESDAVLAIVGPRWSDLMQEKAVHDEIDYVRLELEIAQELGKPIFPIFLVGGKTPSARHLPETLREAFRLNAFRIPDEKVLNDTIQDLTNGIRYALERINKKQKNLPNRVQPPKRTKPSVLEILPQPFAWCDIPAGKVTLEAGGYLEQDTVFEVPAFQIAKYPITNAQFRVFVEAGGYENQAWWTEDGWKHRVEGWVYDNGWKPSGTPWTEPRYWQDSKWNGAEQPVVGVSWYESVAFCLWLSDVTGERIMLPTEQQWQRAAQGDDGRKYPWGAWEEGRCNYGNKIGQTTPVMQFEGQGDSPYGVVDMSGNVREWCLTGYSDGDNDQNKSSDTERILRGGSWNSNRGYARAAYRSRYYPNDRNDRNGLRVVCVCVPLSLITDGGRA